jgi:hypothetical protein
MEADEQHRGPAAATRRDRADNAEHAAYLSHGSLRRAHSIGVDDFGPWRGAASRP